MAPRAVSKDASATLEVLPVAWPARRAWVSLPTAACGDDDQGNSNGPRSDATFADGAPTQRMSWFELECDKGIDENYPHACAEVFDVPRDESKRCVRRGGVQTTSERDSIPRSVTRLGYRVVGWDTLVRASRFGAGGFTLPRAPRRSGLHGARVRGGCAIAVVTHLSATDAKALVGDIPEGSDLRARAIQQ